MAIDHPPPPAPTPPSIEEVTQEHLDIAAAVRALQRAVARLELRAHETSSAVSKLGAHIGHLADTRTVDRLTVDRLERVMLKVAAHLGVKVPAEHPRPHENGRGKDEHDG